VDVVLNISALFIRWLE